MTLTAPYSLGLVGDEQQAGPIVSLVNARRFDHVVLTSTPNTYENTTATESVLKGLNPKLGISIIEGGLSDPTDCAEILSALRSKILPA